MKYFSSISTLKTLLTILNVLIVRKTYSEKYKAYEFDSHLVHRISILQAYIQAYSPHCVSISESGLKF